MNEVLQWESRDKGEGRKKYLSMQAKLWLQNP